MPEQTKRPDKDAMTGKGFNASVPQCPTCQLWLIGVKGKTCDRADCPTDLPKHGMTKA